MNLSHATGLRDFEVGIGKSLGDLPEGGSEQHQLLGALTLL
jgi:hypothetical protein